MSKCNDKTTNPSILIDVNDMVSHNIDFDCCENNKNVVLDSQNLSSTGRFLSVTTTIKKFIMQTLIALMIILFWLYNFLSIKNISFYIFVELFALLSIPCLLLYNGQKGRTNLKWLFYIFYPTHILLIYLLQLFI